jgi:hypothetical protein
VSDELVFWNVDLDRYEAPALTEALLRKMKDEIEKDAERELRALRVFDDATDRAATREALELEAEEREARDWRSNVERPEGLKP